MLANIPAVHVYRPRRVPPRRGHGEHGPLAHMLVLVAVSLIALAFTRLDTLAALGFWGSVRALALAGAGELLMLLLALAIVRGLHRVRLR